MYVAGKPEERRNESTSREQYFRFEEDVQNSLSGRLLMPPLPTTAATAHVPQHRWRVDSRTEAAARDRMPITDDTMLRPSDEPTMATVEFDWIKRPPTPSLAARISAATMTIKRRELELLASQNFLLPRLILPAAIVPGLGKTDCSTVAPRPDRSANLFTTVHR